MKDYGYSYPCEHCGGPTFVTNSRPSAMGTIRRRRTCRTCNAKIVTVEIFSHSVSASAVEQEEGLTNA